MYGMTLIQQKHELRRETASWQAAALGLLVLSVAVNMGLLSRVDRLETVRAEEAAAYQDKLLQAERIRDQAVGRLGELVRQAEKDAQARAEQAIAYEAVGIYRYIGECTVTYYCPCEECCGPGADGLTATGIPAAPGVVAVDPDVIPLGSTVVIDGQRYLAADTGVTGHHADIAVSGHQEALDLGSRTLDVWVEAVP